MRGNIRLDEVIELILVDVAVTVTIDELEDEGGPLSGALDEICDLSPGDTTITVGVDDLVEGV